MTTVPAGRSVDVTRSPAPVLIPQYTVPPVAVWNLNCFQLPVAPIVWLKLTVVAGLSQKLTVKAVGVQVRPGAST